MSPKIPDDELNTIPAFLDVRNRKGSPSSQPTRSEVMSKANVETPATPAAPAAVKAKGPKAHKAQGNGHTKAAKPAKVAKSAKAAKPFTAKAPRIVDPLKLDKFGFRLDTLKSQAAAMYASKHGATLAEIKEALGSTQFNLLTELEEKGFEIERGEVASATGRKVTKYKIKAK